MEDLETLEQLEYENFGIAFCGSYGEYIGKVRYRNVRKFKSSLSFPVTDKIDAAATTTRTGIAATAAATAADAGGPISVP
uniref:Uncharacterized protein n=1 Tax=Vespula pensylvanica TaxID=30213 RepID=A0A834K6J7_VESPE|nr:hypothetical protein H0235_015813 [Vespula pensylvanica]